VVRYVTFKARLYKNGIAQAIIVLETLFLELALYINPLLLSLQTSTAAINIY
jgi:hypothetical protein